MFFSTIGNNFPVWSDSIKLSDAYLLNLSFLNIPIFSSFAIFLKTVVLGIFVISDIEVAFKPNDPFKLCNLENKFFAFIGFCLVDWDDDSVFKAHNKIIKIDSISKIFLKLEKYFIWKSKNVVK